MFRARQRQVVVRDHLAVAAEDHSQPRVVAQDHQAEVAEDLFQLRVEVRDHLGAEVAVAAQVEAAAVPAEDKWISSTVLQVD
jgi:hypothetical protein